MNTIARFGAVAVTALAGTLAACHHGRTPTDAELTNLLRLQTAQPNDPAARLDPSAVDCLRAWSGDADLAKPLPPASASDAAKNACRQRIDGWIADAARNPDKLSFGDVSAPPAVRQAIALLQQHRGAAAALPSLGDRPPAMMMRPMPGAPTPSVAPTLPKGPVDVSKPTAELKELDGLCKQAKDSASAGSSAPIARYAPMCERRIAQMRERVDQLKANGGTTREAEMLSDNVHRMLVFGRQLASANASGGNTNPPPPAPKKN